MEVGIRQGVCNNSPADNVDKGSRQNRSVTSGKGLALRVGYIGPWLEATGPGWDCLGQPRRTWPGPVCGWPWLPSGVRCTLNNQLRTGTDKGNLTV